MKDNKFLLPAVILGVSIVIFGIILGCAASAFINKDRQVTVKGLSEREVPANIVSWSFTTSITGDALPALYAEVQATNAKVVKFLRDNGLSDEEITVLPPEVDDRISNRWSNERIPFNYKLTTPISVSSTNVALVQEIVMKQGDLIREGIAIGGDNSLRYDYTGFQELKQEMVEEALANAKVTAAQITGSFGSRPGKVITADQGQFSIYSKSDNPSMMKVRGVATITYSIAQ